MFSGNDKISARQFYRNHAAQLISLSALFPPLLMNGENMGGILTSLGLLGVFLAWSAAVPAPEALWAKCLCYAHYWLLGTLIVHMTGLLIQEFLLTDTELAVILGWFYLLCFYNLYKGLECRSRVGEILFPFFIVLLVLLPLLMYGEVEGARVRELKIHADRQQAVIGYELFCWLGAVQSLWHLRKSLKEKKQWVGGIVRIWGTGAAMTILWCLFVCSVYGKAGHTGLVFPLASAMTLAHFPGNVIGRLDALFVFAWIIGLFLLCSSLFAPLTAEEPNTRVKYLLFALMAASFCLSLKQNCMEWGQWILYRVSTPIQVLLLGFSTLSRGGRKRIRMALVFLLLVLSLLLTGCSAQELEQQSQVTAIGVDEGTGGTFLLTFGFGTTEEEGEEPFSTEASSLEEAEQEYWETCQKHMDFNHLKNFYFSEKVLWTEEIFGLLDEIQTHGAYSRGTMIYVTEGPAASEAGKKDQPEEGIPIHRLLNAWYNKEECRILTVTEDGRYRGSILWKY